MTIIQGITEQKKIRNKAPKDWADTVIPEANVGIDDFRENITLLIMHKNAIGIGRLPITTSLETWNRVSELNAKATRRVAENRKRARLMISEKFQTIAINPTN